MNPVSQTDSGVQAPERLGTIKSFLVGMFESALIASIMTPISVLMCKCGEGVQEFRPTPEIIRLAVVNASVPVLAIYLD